MKKLFSLLLSLFIGSLCVHADEGMWLLKLMEQQHLADSLRRAGLQLPPAALYSETSPSLRQCVGIFGGGCTAEVVSPDGLLFTNHHCGFSTVHEMSTVGNDIVKNGYFAKSREQELRTPDLSFTFVLAVQEVTDEVEAAARKQKADAYEMQSQAFLEPLAKKMLKQSKYAKLKGMRTRLIPFFGGNRFYIFYEQTYNDIRLVVNPPYNVGQFGGNTDNWVWPRHNPDFAVFRIYADKKGRPAAYSKDNVPLKTPKYLPISLKGMKEGDYTMIMGFPGTTTRYLTAAEVRQRVNDINAPVVLVGNPLLAFLKGEMEKSDSIRLKLEDLYFGYGNMVKKYGGMSEAVEKTKLVEAKEQEEQRFRQFAKTAKDPAYATIIDRIDSLCHTYADSLYDRMLMNMTYGLQRAYAPAKKVDDWVKAVRSGKTKDITTAAEALTAAVKPLSLTQRDIDHRGARLVMPYYLKNNRLGLVPACLKNDPLAFIDRIYATSIYLDKARFEAAVAQKDTAALTADPLYTLCSEFVGIWDELNAARKHFDRRHADLDKIYVRGLNDMYAWTKAPDANFTMRMTYGHVKDLKPRDAVHYDWQTTLDGMFEKASKTESDYFANDTLRTLWEKGDYGRYAREDGKLPTCFLSDNDITGGNSGSPVMNAKGELIGLAFDGNIESLSSDLKYNPTLQRCINVDVRYVLFIIDKFGGSSYLFKELDLR